MKNAEPELEFDLQPAGKALRPGTRLVSVEVLNWGTFDARVWRLDLNGDNALLTGDIGSGKSTFVDAITTLLVPSQRIDYNKAAGAEKRERDLRSYVLGYYKSERAEEGLSAKPVALRDHSRYSVILGRFRNEGYGEEITLAQVFYFREREGQPLRFYVVASAPLSIVQHFSFNKDIGVLKKRFRKMQGAQMFDSFPPYAAAFRRLLGIQGEQALDLFHQTVSMKSVGDLTDFVRAHMLEPFAIEKRIADMIAHFADLTRAHEAVLKAKDQVTRLEPIAADCDRHAAMAEEQERQENDRDALSGYFAQLKAGLLEKRLANLEGELAKLRLDAKVAQARLEEERQRRDQVKQAIAENGGERIESLGREIAVREKTKGERQRRWESYKSFAAEISLKAPKDANVYVSNRTATEKLIESAEARRETLDNALTEDRIAFRGLKDEYAKLESEIASLKKRKSNLPKRVLDIRESLCASLGLKEASLPFAGELIEVRKEERDWEGAAERVLHNFALSLLVPDRHYGQVAAWVDSTHLGERLVYYRVREQRTAVHRSLLAHSLVNKLAVKNSPFYDWLDRELAQRFDYACCENLDQFRREESALTKAGQIKGRGERHEKDDRHAIGDRTRYVLGWSNEDKIAALAAAAGELKTRMQALGEEIAARDTERKALQRQLDAAQKLAAFASFEDLDWMAEAAAIERLAAERRELEDGSDLLRTLRSQLIQVEANLRAAETKHNQLGREEGALEEKRKATGELLEQSRQELAAVPAATKEDCWPRLDAARDTALGEHRLTVESCEGHQRTFRQYLQDQIAAAAKRIARLREAIVKAMQAYMTAYPAETREVDAAVEAAADYKAMLDGLVSDGLPKFEARFKALLNENTIREIAGFQSQLYKERELIRERIGVINTSLKEIDYNPGRYIELLAEPSPDQEIRQFQLDLRACTQGTLTGSDEDDYSEAKFLEVKRIVERFKGREGTADLDKRWTRKVTDVRNWFSFSASERWREDGREHEHYTDSGGKSGGQKEKLAYTILAASLAYQFGLERGAERSRSFHFVMIDEAFGRGSDNSATYGLTLFKTMNLQLLVATPLQKIHVIEPFVSAVGFVHNEGGKCSMLRNMTIEEYREQQRIRRAG